jgi:hypothetical protein
MSSQAASNEATDIENRAPSRVGLTDLLGDLMAGVSVEFFCAAIKALSKVHGHRQAGPAIEQVRAALEEAERTFMSLPIYENQSTSSSRGTRDRTGTTHRARG